MHFFLLQQMLAESVRSVRALQQGAVPDEVQQLASKSLWLHHFIRYAIAEVLVNPLLTIDNS